MVKGPSRTTTADEKIRKSDDWRERTLAKVRQLIKQSDPEIVEEVKWKKPSNPDGIPVWYHERALTVSLKTTCIVTCYKLKGDR